MCALLVGSAGNAHASEDDIYYGDFMGDELPIYPVNPDISYFATLNGYTYYTRWRQSGVDYSVFNGGVTFPDLVNKTISLSVTLPEDLSAGTTVNVKISGTFGGGTYNPNYVRFFDDSRDSYMDVSYEFTTNGFYWYLSISDVSVNFPLHSLSFYMGLSDFEDVNWGMYVTNIDIDSPDRDPADDIKQDTGNILTQLINLPSNIASNIKGFFDSVVDAITSLPAKIKDALASSFDSVVDAVVSLGAWMLQGFTDIFDGWYDTDAELDESVKDSWEIGSGLELDESELIENALSDINHVDFIGGFTGELVTALLWLLPYQDKFYNSLGLVKDVIVVALTIGLVTLLLGRGLRTLSNYGGRK